MRVRTVRKDDFHLAGKIIPAGSLYINEPNMLTAYVADFQIYSGTKTGNHYLRGNMFLDGKWHKATFFETGTIFIGRARFGGGRFPEIFHDFWQKLPAAKHAAPAKYAGIDDNKPAEPRSRIADITPMHGTAYSLKMLNDDNADTWTFGGKPTSSGTDSVIWAATGKVTRNVAKPAKKDFAKQREIYVGKTKTTKEVKKYHFSAELMEYLEQFNQDEYAEVIFRDAMTALRDNFA